MAVAKIVKAIDSQRTACPIFDTAQDYSKLEASLLLMRYTVMGNGEYENITTI
jgi:hypothetical protein